jgi:branched-chain amino acid transport system permease protein
MAVALVPILALCALYGVLVEILAVRPFVKRGSDAWLMATVALGIVLDNIVLFTFGKEPRGLSSALASATYAIAGIQVSALQLLIPVVGVALAIALHVVARRTRWGIAMLAVVQNPDAARLMGIPAARVVVIAFALSSMFAGIAGILIAPLYNIHSDMGTLFGLKAFAVAILGGITNARGVMLAGLIFGVVEALVTALLGSGYTQIITFALVIAALAWRPDGLFARARVHKV